MSTIVSQNTIDKSDLNMENAKAYGASGGLIVAGFISAHVATKLIKKTDSIIVNGGVAAASLVVAMKVKNPYAKLALLGVFAYSTLRCVNIGVSEVAAPGDGGAAGLSGLIPESVKSKLREYIPTLGGSDDAQNLLGLGNTEEEVMGFNLDDVADMGAITEDATYEDVTNQQAVGTVSPMI